MASSGESVRFMGERFIDDDPTKATSRETGLQRRGSAVEPKKGGCRTMPFGG
ncbi:UNVERIFIED_CONTAM: hypothetical protein Slati_2494400 [Sesamum latifolium]|uniref:Uncharacterized protein n=1 Tax=Sesamum latifolium TaxID=2727402 RepID=A0AAW2WGC1_9LAMI